jgi:tripartite-type tricarboxylate transporter receptor subunit TctC
MVETAVASLRSIVADLVERGASDLLVPNLPDIGMTPKPLLGTIVVENMGGSSLGAAAVARAKPDGYTILLGGTLPHVNETLIKARPLYDPARDVEPIAGIAVAVLALAVHPTIPAQTLAELGAHARANPVRLSYGHVGVGPFCRRAGSEQG